jgi:hypothetical protein
MKKTDVRWKVVPLETLSHVSPPSVVRNTVPASPTATPVLTSVNETPYRLFVVPVGFGVHVLPPSVVRSIVPRSPTAVPALTSVKKTLRRMFPVGIGFCQFQSCWEWDIVGHINAVARPVMTIITFFIEA